MKKRLISLLLCLTMIFTLISFPTTSKVSGEDEIWNEVYTVEDLQAINNDLTANYILMNDIDLTEATAPGGDWDYLGNGWNPIGSNNNYGATAFSGQFNGNGYSITGMRIEINGKPSTASRDFHVGLFAKITGKVTNLNLAGTIIISHSGNQVNKIGSIAGALESEEAIISNCTANCSINIDLTSNNYKPLIGGIVGTAVSKSTISSCVNMGNIFFQNDSVYAGGIVGEGSNSYIYNCVNNGDISGTHGGDILGGILGKQNMYNCKIYSSYNRGNISNGYGIWAYGDVTAESCYYLAGTGNISSGATSLTDAQMKLQSMFVGFDFDNTWIIYPDSAYPYPQLRSNPIDTENAVESIQVTTLPTKLTFVEGDSLNFSGGKITIYYKDGSTDERALTRSMISGFDSTLIGTQTLTVTFGRNVTTYTITILPKSVSGISIAALPTKTQYIEGLENLDLTGGLLLVNYDNGTTGNVALSDAVISGFDNTIVGEQTLTATYSGFSTTFTVEIIPKSMSAIEMHTLPTKLSYIEGKELLDVTGGKLRVRYNNGTEDVIDLTADMVSGFSNAVVGTRRLTVTYNSFITYFDVEIVAKSVSAISVIQLPNKLTYIEGLETLAVAGGRIRVDYNNGTYNLLDMSRDMVSGFDNNIVGMQTLTVTYGGCTATFEVEIIAKSVTSIEIARYPDKLLYLEGKDTLNVSGGRIRVLYNNGTSGETDMSAATVTGFDNTIVGMCTLTVTYSGKSTSFRVEIVAKQLVAIEMNDLPAKLTYLEGKDALNVFGGRLKLTYDNDTTSLIDLTAAMVSGFDNTRVGVQTLVVNYEGFSTTFTVTIVAKSVRSISLVSLPYQLTYLEGSEELDTYGGVLLVTYDNDQTEQIGLTPEMVSGFDNGYVGFQMLTVTYGTRTAYFEVEIIHDFVPTEVEPTCTEDGYIEYVCAHCGESYIEAGAAATGHEFVHYISDGNASCTEDGTATAICEHCDATDTIEDVGSATGHCFGEWIVDTEPTETSTGMKYRLCEHCGEIDEKTIPMLGRAPSITVSDVDVVAGQEFNVDIVLADNSGIIAMSLNIDYDTDVFELIGTANGAFTGLSYGPTDAVPFVVSWEDSLNGNNSTNGVFVTLRFRVKDDADAESSVITVTYDEDNVFDAAFENVYFSVQAGTVTIRQYAPGDVNRDGSVNLKDYALLKQFVNGWDVDIEESVADVNADGKINLKDVALLNQYINGWDVVLK